MPVGELHHDDGADANGQNGRFRKYVPVVGRDDRSKEAVEDSGSSG